MVNNDQISSVVWFFIGLLVMVFSLPYSLGDIHSPGTGFMPFFTGVAVCIFSGLVFWEASEEKKGGKTWENPFQGVRWGNPLVTVIALIFYALVLGKAGFILATTGLVGFLLRAIYPQGWKVVIAGALLTSLATYLIFKVLLETQLPTLF